MDLSSPRRLPALAKSKSERALTVVVVGQQATLVSNAESRRTWKMVRFRHEFPGLARDTSIKNIKEMLSMLVGIAPNHQEILRNGLQLKDTDTLQSQGIGHNEMLRLEKRRLGSLAPIARRRDKSSPKVQQPMQSYQSMQAYQSMRSGGMWGGVRAANGATAIEVWKRRIEQAAAENYRKETNKWFTDKDIKFTSMCDHVRKKRLQQISDKEAQLMRREWARAFCDFDRPLPNLTLAEVIKPQSTRRIIRKRESGWHSKRWSTPRWVTASQTLGKFFRRNPGLARWTGRTLLRFYNPKSVCDENDQTPKQKRDEEQIIRMQAMAILRARKVDEQE